MSTKNAVNNTISRRSMLKTILYTPPILMFSKGGLFADQDPQPLFAPRIISPGQKVRTAVIGVYHRGAQVIDEFNRFGDQIEFTAFADLQFGPDARHAHFPDVPCFRDYRQMFEEMHDQIDAVIINTPDHSHFPHAVHAMLLGKHVYVEKPLAQNVLECRILETLTKKCKGLVTQMGNQGHHRSGTKQFGRWVQAGLMDNVRKIDAWMAAGRRWHGWTHTTYPEQIPPVGFDWDIWLGGRQFRPYSDLMVHGNWRCWFEFGCGAMGDWGAHILDAIHRYYLKCAQPYEITTELIDPSTLYYPQGSRISMKFKAPDGGEPIVLNWYDGRGHRPEKSELYPGNMGNFGSFVHGEDFVIRGRSHGRAYEIFPEAKRRQLQQAGKAPDGPTGPDNHYQNFLNACQGIEPASSSFDVAAPLSEMMCLGCIGQKFGGTLKYDAERMRITNHNEANKMLKGPAPREGWQAYHKPVTMKSKTAQIKKPHQVTWENLTDKGLTQWVNPYGWGKAEVVNGEVHLTTESRKWFLMTKNEFANFIFEVDVKMPPNAGNSGFQFRSQMAKNRVWGYQAEVDPSARAWSGGLFDEGRRRWFISPNRDHAPSPQARDASIAEFRARAGDAFKQGQWNRYRIECIGSHIRIFVNGVLTTDIHDEMDLTGHIGLQHHGERDLVYKFRNIRIKDLGPGGALYYPHREDAEPPRIPPKMQGHIYEAEDAPVMRQARVSNRFDGYQGTGFVELHADSGSYLEWDNVLADEAGEFTLTFRYAAVENSPCDLYINGQNVGRIAFAATESWDNWKTVDKKVTFTSGSNAVRVVAVGRGPNLDALAVN